MSDQTLGEGGALALSLITASMDANFATMDRLYEGELERRRALEVHIDEALARFESTWGGTVREYEAAVSVLRAIPYGDRQAQMAARHHEAMAR